MTRTHMVLLPTASVIPADDRHAITACGSHFTIVIEIYAIFVVREAILAVEC